MDLVGNLVSPTEREDEGSFHHLVVWLLAPMDFFLLGF